MEKKTGKLFAKYVSLNVLGMIGLSCYILADTFFVANGLGADGLTALNLAIPIYSFINGAGLMMGMGAATRYSITGKRSGRRAGNEIFSQAAVFTLITGLLFVLIGLVFSDPLASMLGADAVTHDMTNVYLKTILCFTPMFMMNNVLICFVRNDGNPNLAMLAMVAGSASNIALDYLFIFPLNMGMFGAAFATGIAPVVSMLVLSVHFIKKKHQFSLCKVKPEADRLKDYIALGVSSLVTEVSSGVVIIIYNIIILRLAGNTGVAAYGVIANLALVILSIFNGVGQGIQPLLSHFYGSGELDKVKQIFRYAVVTVIAGAVLIYAVTYMGAEPITGLFNRDRDAALTDMAVEGLHLYFTAFAFAGVNIVTAVKYSSIDKPLGSFMLSIARGFLFVVPAAFIMAEIFGMKGVWLSFPVAELLTMLFHRIITAFHRLNTEN